MRAEGEMVISVQRGKKRYYQVFGNKRHYLGKNDGSLIADLVQKQYEEGLLSSALEERRMLQSCLNLIRELDKQNTLGSLDEDLKKYIIPDVSTDDGFARSWIEEAFVQQDKTEWHKFETLSKDKVRSKSEVLIADRLFHAGIPFRYEQLLVLGKMFPGHRYYPDFTILNKRTRQVYLWEHFGKMSDRDYCSENLKKLEVYAKYGILPGKNLILTFESEGKPISTAYIDKMIETFLK